jgi:hypothetical protein
MAYAGLTVEYTVKTTGDQWFIPGNCQAPTNSHDNPDNGTTAERAASNALTSPDGVEVVAT